MRKGVAVRHGKRHAAPKPQMVVSLTKFALISICLQYPTPFTGREREITDVYAVRQF